MDKTQLDDALGKLKDYKDRGLIRDFEVRGQEAVVTLIVPLVGFEIETDAANRISIATHRVVR
jgi:hypothetical protein